MLYHLNLQYNEDLLLLEAESLDYNPFSTGGNKGSWFDYAPTWEQAKVTDLSNFMFKEVKRLTDLIQEVTSSKDVRPRFYKQQENTEVPPHIDHNTKCSINIVLSDNYGPIQFTGQEPAFYKCAVLDTSKEHWVPPYDEERLLLKFSIFDITFNDVVNSFKRTI